MEQAVFVVGALICVLGAVGVVSSRNPVHAALSLVGTLFGVAILFIAQDAEFLAAVQVIVYAGAIVVLFLFVIMLLGTDQTDDLADEPLRGQRILAALAGAGVAGIVLFAVVVKGKITGQKAANGRVDPALPNVEQLARVLFTRYLWAFEITSVLLIIAVVGAVALARHRKDALVDDEPADELEDVAS